MTFNEIIDAIKVEPYYLDREYGQVIYCGDCREILPLIPDKSIDLVLTDPPYGINYRSNHRRERFEYIKGDDAFPKNWFGNSKLTPNGSCYVFCNETSLDMAKLALLEVGFNTIRMLVWDKGATAGGDLGDYGTRCEYILYSKHKAAKLRGSRDSNLISIPRVHPTVLTHPAEKPETLVSYLIMKSTEYNEIVFDPFLGSGTTAYCAKKLNRKCIGIEINEKYCEIATRRCSQGVMRLEV